MSETKDVRLTEKVKAGGCASKLSPAVLDAVLGKLPRQTDPNVLVGFDHADDAGVYRLGPDSALVQTVDFFTPIVDDPYTFGQIAATNALSDVYAMGGRPITALAMVCFPEKEDIAILEQILAGGLSKMVEANCTIVGGHSIRDEEIKFGYAVTGLVNPNHVLANNGARSGDRLLFTKSLGTGVISTAIKRGSAQPSWIAAAIKSMTTLNKTAAEIIASKIIASKIAAPTTPTWEQAPPPAQASKPEGSADPSASTVHSLTDVTGFGLIGHAREMALASNVALRFFASRIPVMEGALECVRAGNLSGGLKANRDFAECLVAYDDTVPEDLRTLLFDPQTAGGLLISVAATGSQALQSALRAAGVPAVEIGEVLPAAKPLISIAA